jgi:hypothetical protein
VNTTIDNIFQNKDSSVPAQDIIEDSTSKYHLNLAPADSSRGIAVSEVIISIFYIYV